MEDVTPETQQAATSTGPAWLQTHIILAASLSSCPHMEQHEANADTVPLKLHAGYKTLVVLCQKQNVNSALDLQPVWHCKAKGVQACNCNPFQQRRGFATPCSLVEAGHMRLPPACRLLLDKRDWRGFAALARWQLRNMRRSTHLHTRGLQE